MMARQILQILLLYVTILTGTGAAGGPNTIDPGTAGPVHVWLDLSSYLPEGILRQVDVTVGPHHVQPQHTLWIQLWSPSEPDEDTKVYSLKWQKLIHLDKGGDRSYEVLLKTKEMVSVEDGDKIGWTANSDAVQVSSSFDESYGSLLYTAKPGEVLKLGRNYTFDGLLHPHHFSITTTVKERFVRKDGVQNMRVDVGLQVL